MALSQILQIGYHSCLTAAVAASDDRILACCSPGLVCSDSRDHFLELPQRGLGIGARGHIVLDLVDERRIGYTSGVGGGVLAPAAKYSPSVVCAREMFSDP